MDEKITDYHDFTTIDTSVKERERLGVGDIWINAARCHKCGDEIRSRNRHDFRTCKCGDVSVDGGSFYVRRLYKEGAQYDDIIEPYRETDSD